MRVIKVEIVFENRTRTKLTQVIFGGLRIDRTRSYKYSGAVREILREREREREFVSRDYIESGK